jgi:two-component system cell cycle response regulator
VASTDSTAARPTSARLARRALVALLVGGTALVALHDWLGLGGERFDFLAGGPLYDAVVVAAGVACLLKARESARERWAWLAIGVAVLAWAAGETYWTWFLLDEPAAPVPSPADAGYLLFYPLAVLGLALLVRARAYELDSRRWLDGLIAALGTAALGTAFVFDFVAADATGTGLERALTLAYPLGDIAVLGLIVGAIAVSDWRPGRVWSLLLAGLAAQVVADIAFTLQSTDNALPASNWVDPIYLLSAVFVGLATLRPRARPILGASPDVRQELAVPLIFITVMSGLFVMQSFGSATWFSTALRAITVLAVIARLAVSVRENRLLLERVRTDPLTGLCNRGTMHADLALRCAAATEERAPAALALFDLNGFKRYNDTFGHPAGDALLAKLGPSLAEAIGGDGTAYRVGGDEFCALLECAEDRFDEVCRRAAGALSARGPGFEVGASWGLVAIPREADDPAEALELADVRMYAQKESRRLAQETQETGETVRVAAWPRARQDA